MKLRGGAGPHSIYLSYIAVGVGATALMLVAIPVVCYIGPFPVDWSIIWTAFALVAAGALVVMALPWRRMVSRQVGQLTLYAWSLLDVGAVAAVIAATGGVHSWFWVVFVLTTVFFSVGYPFGGQLLLLLGTVGAYLAAIVAAGSPVASPVVLWRVSAILASFVMASFPALELRRQTAEHQRAKQEADQLAARLEQRERWWRSLIERVADPIVVFDHARNIVFVSPAFESLLGYASTDAADLDLSTVVHPDDLRRVQDAVARVGAAQPRNEVLCRVRRKDGAWRHLEVSFSTTGADATTASVVANLHDVTKRVEAEAALTHQATHDPLTGLSNSRAFYHSLDLSLAVAKRQLHPLALLLIDLDQFKLANDTFGHAFGDQLLIGVARRLEATLREADVIARLGGDEFTAILTSGGDPVGAMAAARRLSAALGAGLVIAGRPLHVRVSVGVACLPEHGDDPDELLRCADHAMYCAKRAGGGAALYQPEPAPDAVV